MAKAKFSVFEDGGEWSLYRKTTWFERKVIRLGDWEYFGTYKTWKEAFVAGFGYCVQHRNKTRDMLAPHEINWNNVARHIGFLDSRDRNWKGYLKPQEEL